MKKPFKIILFCLIISGCKDNSVPLLPDKDIVISEVSSNSLKVEWTPSPSDKNGKGYYYKAVISPDPSIYDNIEVAASMTDYAQISDWNQNTFTGTAHDLKPDTDYYVAVLVKKESGKPVMYKPVKTRTIKEPEDGEIDLSVKPPEMVFVKGGKMNIQGKDVILEDFYIGKYEVTIREYYSIEKWGYEHGYIKNSISLDNVSDLNKPFMFYWPGTIVFCNLLSMSIGLDPVYYQDKKLTEPITDSNFAKTEDFYINNSSNGYKIPCEIEWEYAARGGEKSKGFIYSGGNDLDEVSWHDIGNHSLNEIGKKKSNEIGLFDMSGNAAEWCIDYWTKDGLFDEFNKNDVYQYNTTDLSDLRVIKGGWSFHNFYSNFSELPPTDFEPKSRSSNSIKDIHDYNGLRVIRNK
jgi:formylglycine-generating enzyme